MGLVHACGLMSSIGVSLGAVDWTNMQGVLDSTWLGTSVQNWGLGAATAIGVFIVLSIVRKFVVGRARSFGTTHKVGVFALLGAVVAKTSFLVVFAVALWAGSQFLTIPERGKEFLRGVVTVAVAIQGAIWAMAAMEFALEAYLKKRRAESGQDDASLRTAVPAVTFIGRLVILAIAVLLALQNLGIDVTALVAGLGIGGIAIALAVQNILGDLFSSLSIVLDKPFVVGDFIIVGESAGTVEHIGLKSTRVRSLWGEQLVFRNTDLLASRIRNFKRMQERRIVVTIGVTYQTPVATLRALPGEIKSIIEKQKSVRFDRAHFKSFGNFSLDFEYVYWVLSAEYNQYMDIQQGINLDLAARFEELKVEFAYPTQTVFIEKSAAAE
ncbi:MAG: mechanosensitive ion channel family protein [Phycisphaerales bacterium]